MTSLHPKPTRLAGCRSHGEPFEPLSLTFPVASADPPADATTAGDGGVGCGFTTDTALEALTEQAEGVDLLPYSTESLSELADAWRRNHQLKRLAIHQAETWLFHALQDAPQSTDADGTVAVPWRVVMALASEALR